MHIALVHRDLHAVTRGGIATIYRALAPRLHRAGHQVTLLTQDAPEVLRLPRIETVVLPRTENLPVHRDAVAAALDQCRPDVVESSTWEAETLHYLRGRSLSGRRAPVLVRGDLSAATMTDDSDLIAAERDLVTGADDVIAVSDYAAADLASVYGLPRPSALANGVDRDRFRPHPGAGPAMRPTGGYRVVLGADARPLQRTTLTAAGQQTAPWSRDRDGRVQLVWVGKATPMKGWDRLEALAVELADLAQITVVIGHAAALCPVHLTGGPGDPITVLQDLPERDMPGLYQAADWLLCTSRWEGFGLAIAEALASGTPALLPAELGAAPELLAAGGGRTYRDTDELRGQLTGPRPRGVLPARFDWDTNTTHTLARYRRLTSAAGTRGPGTTAGVV